VGFGGLFVAACSFVPQASGDNQATLISRSSTGWIRFGPTTLHFETSTCSAQPDRFVVVGMGTDEGEKFLVRVRAKDVVEVRYGTHDEMEANTGRDHQLTAPQASLEADGRAIRGTAMLLDSARPEDGPFLAELRVDCDPTGTTVPN
jgi:hypothetical protein